ncbi:MAG: hypothetical protein M3O70_05100 [Actinomycetota bacterium]|nr:hypothetical protein [Actinomycetota bacterium]
MPHRSRPVAGLLAAALVATLAAVPAAASRGGGPPCAPPVPVSDVQRGMVGTGYTVVSGTTPQTFSVEVLGVLENAVGPGRHLIAVDTSGPIIDQAGGIWFGMSGSPVFVDGRFLGAVSYGLSSGPSSVGGITPAEDMLEVLNLPVQETAHATAAPRQANMNREMRAAVAGREGVPDSQVGDFRRLLLPFSVSGVSSQRLAILREAAQRAGLPLLPYAGSASGDSTTSSADTHIAPGDNFAAVVSYGDLTAAAIGTTSQVCEGRVLAFGHPFLHRGSTALGANTADALLIVGDPNFGPYKLAVVREALGTVDQDRLAAIRARLGSLPPLARITSTVKGLTTGRSRTGLTDVADQELLPLIAAFHTLGNLEVVFDQVSEGNSELSFSVTGTRASGQPWSLSRDNRFTSRSDISFDSVSELLTFLAVLSSNPFEDVRFTKVQVGATVEQVVRQYTIGKVLVARDGDYVEATELEVQPGDTIDLRVLLTPFQSSAQVPVDLRLEVPADAAPGDGVLEVTGGSGGREVPLECLFDFATCPDVEGVGSFDELLEALQGRPRNDELVARLRLSTDGRPGGETVVEVRRRLDRVVEGARAIPVRPAPVEPESGA